MAAARKTSRAFLEKFSKASAVARLSPARMLSILRKKNELTQAELAARSRLMQAAISSLESARINLGVARARALARVLHVHPAALLFPDWDEAFPLPSRKEADQDRN